MPLPEKLQYVIDALRSGNMTAGKPDSSGKKPLDKRLRGYQLYVKEAEMEGQPVQSYEEWIKSQE
jgi:hypothetical protein